MRKAIAIAIAMCVALSVTSPVWAQEKKKKNPQVVMNQKQLNRLISSLQVQLSTITGDKGDKGDKGEAGAAGSQGAAGEKGAAGERGATGLTGATGAAGAKGDKGDRGDSFLTQGLMFLVRGECPLGTAMAGTQNQWMVYSGTAAGRPWTGSGHELGFSVCLVN